MSGELKPNNVIVIGDVEARLEAEQMTDEFSIDYYKDKINGNILRIGGSIYFLKFWKNEQVRKAYDIIQQALSSELLDRGYKMTGQGEESGKHEED